MCLICTEKVAVHKEYNLKRHYTTRHAEEYAKYLGDERAKQAANLKTCLLFCLLIIIILNLLFN